MMTTSRTRNKHNLMFSLSMAWLWSFSTVAHAVSEPVKPDNHTETMIVTASPLHDRKDRVTHGVTVLKGDELRESATATLGETLGKELGISAASFGTGVSLPVIRGQRANRVKVMQNSIELLDVSNTSPDHASSSEALLAERIEVLRGPATLRFGNGAVGGVVNIINNRIPATMSQQIKASLELRHSSVNDGDHTVFKIDGGEGNIAWHVDGLYRNTNNVNIKGAATLPQLAENDDHASSKIGFIDNTNTHASNLGFGLSHISDNHLLGLSISRLENNYGIPLGVHHHEEEEEHEEEQEKIRIDLQQTRYHLKGEFDDLSDNIDAINLELAYSNYQHTELENGKTGTRFTNDGWEGRLELLHTLPGNWQGAIGIQGGNKDFAAVGSEAFLMPANTRNYGFFWLGDLQLDRGHIELGLRVEHQQIDPDKQPQLSHTSHSFSSTAQWVLSKGKRLNFSLTRSMRMPSVEELMANGPHLATGQFIIGNRNLNKETSLNYEMGYHHQNPHFHISALAFYNDIDNFVYQRRHGDSREDLPVFLYNQRRAVFRGAEAELGLVLSKQISLDLFADYVRATFKGAAKGQRDIPRITPARFGTKLAYHDKKWRANVRRTHVKSQNHPGEGERATKGYHRLDANLSYQFNDRRFNYTLFLRGNNLLNEKIRNAVSFLRDRAPEPGRNLEIGIRVTS